MEEDFIKELGYLGLATRLKRLSDLFMQDGRRLYQGLDVDIEPNWYLIFKILEKYDELSIMEIALRLKLAHPSVITITNKMEQAGYLISSKSDKDSRKRVLRLSAKALNKLPEYTKIWKAGTRGVSEALKDLNALEFIDQLEGQLSKKNFEERTLEQITFLEEEALSSKQNLIEIIDYETKYAGDFAAINFQWLRAYFYIEDYDREVLTNPEKYIMKPGGHILFAKYNNQIAGTIALIVRDNDFELSKMGVLEKYRGLKLGQVLMDAAINYSKRIGKKRIWLDSNRKLTPAITLYKKNGFKEIEVDPSTPYERCNIRMELNF